MGCFRPDLLSVEEEVSDGKLRHFYREGGNTLTEQSSASLPTASNHLRWFATRARHFHISPCFMVKATSSPKFHSTPEKSIRKSNLIRAIELHASIE